MMDDNNADEKLRESEVADTQQKCGPDYSLYSQLQPNASDRELMLKDERLAEALATLREERERPHWEFVRSKSFWYGFFGVLFFIYFFLLIYFGMR